jgi:hypothetical protein
MDFTDSPSKHKNNYTSKYLILLVPCNVTTIIHIHQHIAILTNNITVYVHYADTRKINIHTITQLVRFQPLTTQAYIQSQANPCGICGGQSDIGTGRSPGTSDFSCQHYSALLHTKVIPLLVLSYQLTVPLKKKWVCVVGRHFHVHISVHNSNKPINATKNTNLCT